MGLFLGFDIGGTKCAAVLGDSEGRVLGRRQFATAGFAGPRAALAALAAAGADLAGGQPVLAAGVSCGGPLDSAAGVVLSPPNLPGWDEVPVTRVLGRALGVPVWLQNDANACALAEWRFGAGVGTENCIFLTFGTGLGAGLVLNGRLYEGACGLAGEVGHIRLTEDGPVGYGVPGSFEGWCSGSGLARLAELRLGRPISARALCEAAAAGDAASLAVVEESAEHLGRGLAILVDVLNPERIIIGSVYARAEGLFAPVMRRTLNRYALAQSAAACRVVASSLGESLGDVAALTVAAEGLRARAAQANTKETEKGRENHV